MRFLLCCLATLAFAGSAQAQTPDTTAAPALVLRAERAPQPLGVQILTGSLGATAGMVGGLYVGAGNGDLGTALITGFGGTVFGAAIGAQTTGRRGRFWETLGGAALGTLAGLAVVSAVGNDGLESAAGLAVPIGAGIGAAIANSAGGD